jgi:hypothetical protein
MNQPIEVNFDFALDDSNFIISIRALAALHPSGSHYHIYDFRATSSQSRSNGHSIFPDQEITVIENGNGKTWVHKDSGMETQLSRAIGSSLDRVLDNS